MIRLSPSCSRLPVCLHETSEEDRKTYKKWALGCCVCYLLLIAGLLTAGLAARHSDMQTATGARTAGIGIVAKPVERHRAGG